MCQLILTNLGNKKLNQIATAIAIQAGAAAGNNDGTGIMTVRGSTPSVWKTAMSGGEMLDLGRVSASCVTGDSPVIAHVRAASKGIVISEENAHPFEGERFILAHNGRLYHSGEKVEYTTTGNTGVSSDSLDFLTELEKQAVEHPDKDFLGIANEAMKKFMGKFAFLIFDKSDSTYYICRGSTAPLHIAHMYKDYEYQESYDDKGNLEFSTLLKDHAGFIVMTQKNSLNDACTLITPQLQISTGDNTIFSDPIELDKDTVYKVVGDSITVVGKLEENPVVYATYTQQTGNKLLNQSTRTSNVDLTNDFWRHADVVFSFMKNNFLSIEDIDFLFMTLLGVPIAACSVKDIELFVETAIPKLSAPKKIRKALKTISGSSIVYIPMSAYKELDLEYPWCINKGDKLQELVKYMQKREKNG